MMMQDYMKNMNTAMESIAGMKMGGVMKNADANNKGVSA